MMWKISTVPNHNYTGPTNLIKIDDLNGFSTKELVTNKEKNKSPMWMCAELVKRPTKDETIFPKKISGFVIDYDTFVFDERLKHEITLLYHKSHNGKHRIIVPFSEPIPFTDSRDYKENYVRMLNDLIYPTGKTVEELEKLNILQKSGYSYMKWAYFRPEGNRLHGYKAEFYKPKFIKSKRVFGKIDYSYELDKEGDIRQYDIAHNEEDRKTAKGLLRKLKRFMDTYSSSLSWKPLRDLNKKMGCFFDWHEGGKPPKAGSLQMNDLKVEEGYIPNFYCHYDSCFGKTKKFLEPITELTAKETEKGVPNITDRTTLYLMSLIVKGVIGFRFIELCGIFKEDEMVKRRVLLKSLKFDGEQDAKLWSHIYHESIVLDYKSGRIYDYYDGQYNLISEEALLNRYLVSAGLYYRYRKNKCSETYVKRLIKYGKGYMQKHFDAIEKGDHVNLNNGYILFNSGTWEFKNHNPEFFSEKKMGYSYDANAKCPLWLKVLSDYFGENSVQEKILKQFFGYCLTYDRTFEKLLVLYGESRGGKGTILETLGHLLPSRTGDLVHLLNIDRRSELLDKVKFVTFNEVAKLGDPEIVNKLKDLSSTGNVSVRYLYEQSFELVDVPKFALAFNNPPQGMKFDAALKNRMLSIKFTQSFVGKEDHQLKDKLIKELPGILNWALEGYESLYVRDRETKLRKGFVAYAKDSQYLYELATIDEVEMYEFLVTAKRASSDWLGPDLKQEYMKASDISSKLTSQDFYRRVLECGAKKERKGGTTRIIIPEIEDLKRNGS
jgi:hypothetical protein